MDQCQNNCSSLTSVHSPSTDTTAHDQSQPSPQRQRDTESNIEGLSPEVDERTFDKVKCTRLSEGHNQEPRTGNTAEEKTRHSVMTSLCNSYPALDDVICSTAESSYGESHVTLLQSFVDSVAAGEKSIPWSRRSIFDMTGRNSGNRMSSGTVSSMPSTEQAKMAAVTSSTSRDWNTRTRIDVDQPLDLSVKSPASTLGHRLADAKNSSPSSFGELPLPVLPTPFTGAASLFPLFACRDSWIAHWAALAAASLQQSMLLSPHSMTSSSVADVHATSGVPSTSPRSSSSSSPSTLGSGRRMTDDRRSTALTAMESFVESSFTSTSRNYRQSSPSCRVAQPSSNRNKINSAHANRKRQRHIAADVTSSGDEDASARLVADKRKRSDPPYWMRQPGEHSSSSLSEESSTCDAERQSNLTPKPKAEVNGEMEYLTCGASYDPTTSGSEHPLRSLEKFVGFSPPLFKSSVEPSSANSNGVTIAVITPPRPRADHSPQTAEEKGTATSDDVRASSYRRSDVTATSPAPDNATGGNSATSRHARNDDVISGGLPARPFAGAGGPSLLCCNL